MKNKASSEATTRLPQSIQSGSIVQCILALGISVIALNSHATPRHVYLTWQGDTSSSITVNYQTLDPSDSSTVYFDTKSRKGRHAEYRQAARGSSHQIPGLADGRKVHWVQLTGLKPGKTYYFIAGDPRHGFTAERKFRTVPATATKLRFVTGGDMGIGDDVRLLQQHAARLSPDFGLVGGDLAYANDTLTNAYKWDAWLDHWETNMVTPSGYTIPMVLGIGNHEVRGGAARSPTNALFYLRYFAQAGDRTYYSRVFGKNVALFVLDSGHLTPHDGDQAAWLDAELSAHSRVPQKFAVYHVPLFPSYRSAEGGGSVQGRKVWQPIFDQHHLTAAFENHDHTFKRTKLMRGDKPDPGGTLYLGDGCWGMGARKVPAQPQSYEAKAASIQHFWCVTVDKNRVEYRAFNKEGKNFDVYPPNAPGAKEAEEVYESLRRP